MRELVDDHHSGGAAHRVPVSSIALLQERFRQLQRMQEQRQEKQLLRLMFSQSERLSYVDDHRRSSCSKVMAILSPTTPHDCQLSLSLWPPAHDRRIDSENKTTGSSRGAEAPSDDLTKSWFSSPIKLHSFDSDIDTSLRL